MDDEAIDMLAETGTYLVADVWFGDWIEEQGSLHEWSKDVLRKNEETTEAQRLGFAKAVKAGVKLAFGTDSGGYPHGMNATQFAYQVRCGQTPISGTCAAGRFADLIAVDGDPLEDVDALTDVAVVVKGGEVVKRPAP
jgi:imidazolonepropionase-like amidohydrolase